MENINANVMQLYSGVPNAVPIPNAGKGRPMIIDREKKDKKKERSKEKKLKNSIANAERKRAARAAAAEAKGTDVKGKERKKGKNNIGNFISRLFSEGRVCKFLG